MVSRRRPNVSDPGVDYLLDLHGAIYTQDDIGHWIKIEVWFPSIKAAISILSDDNMALLKAIRERQPRSIDELASVVGREPCDLDIPLRDMERIGLIRLHKREEGAVPEAMVDRVLLHMA